MSYRPKTRHEVEQLRPWRLQDFIATCLENGWQAICAFEQAYTPPMWLEYHVAAHRVVFHRTATTGEDYIAHLTHPDVLAAEAIVTQRWAA